MKKLLDTIDYIENMDNRLLRSFYKACLCVVLMIVVLGIAGIGMWSIISLIAFGEHLTLIENAIMIIGILVIILTLVCYISDVLNEYY